MHYRILDLDGSLTEQTSLQEWYRPVRHDAQTWGPRIRMGCSFGRFACFEHALARRLGSATDAEPAVTLYGSGDFHHVSLALLRRLTQPFNLLIVDKHPDWMRAIPFLHCGTWVYHAARLAPVRRIFHAGGDLDFDNSFRWLAPWSLLRSGKITVFPAIRPFERGAWSRVANQPLRPEPQTWIDQERLEELLEPYRGDLARWPLYISLDKDVMIQNDAMVNWDSGHLALPEVEMIVRAFLGAAGSKLAGMDIVGDWSPVHLRGVLRRFLHLTEHPRLEVEGHEAVRRNQRTNLVLLDSLTAQVEQRQPQRRAA
jgi:hypothetical protein